ncbi:MAG: PAS domain S-box protein, partial [Planctomycetota bacterium]
MTLEHHEQSSSARRDLVLVIAVALVLFVLGVYFELAEKWYQLSMAHEDWELDELNLVLSVISISLAWYAYRRWREWAGEANRRRQSNRELAQQIANQQATEASLRESEARYRSIFNTVSAGIGRTALDDGRVLLANQKLAEMFGYDNVEDFTSEFLFAEHYASPESRDRLLESYKNEPGKPVERVFVSKDGSTIVVQTHGIIDYTSGTVDFVTIDITDQKRAEQILVTSAEVARDRDELAELIVERTGELRTIADNLPVLIARIDLDQRFTFLNATAERWYTIEAGDAVGRPLHEILGERNYQNYRPMIEQALAGQQVNFERKVLYPDGVERIVEVTLIPDFSKDGQVQGIFSLTVNISQRKLAELALKESEQRFRDFADASADWYWDTDSRGVFTYVSPHFETSTGVPVASVLGKSRWEISIQQEEDEEAWREHMNTLENRLPFRDFRSVRRGAKGKPRWVSASGIPRFDERGEFLGYRGTGRDVTAIVETEQAPRKSTERLNHIQKMEAIG